MPLADKATIESRKAFRKVSKTKFAAIRQGKKTVKRLAETGKQVARTIAPHYSGRTANLIIVRKKGLPNGEQARIIAQNPTKGTVNRASSGQYKNFNVVRWMHQTKGYFRSPNPFSSGGRHIKSGDPQFMYTTRRFLNKIKKGVARGQFRNIKLK